MSALLISVALNFLLAGATVGLWLIRPPKGPGGSILQRHRARTEQVRKFTLASLEAHEKQEYIRLYNQEGQNIIGVSNRLDELEQLASMRMIGRDL